MAPKKQVSPAIRILRGERDASARATHLEAATRKFLVATNERKQMSTTTNFKRIVLVTVAALGFGVISAIPSSAAVSSVTTPVTNGATTLRASSTTLVNADTGTGTGATISVTALVSAATDSVTVSFFNKNTLSTTGLAYLALVDTTTSSISRVSNAGVLTHAAATSVSGGALFDSSTSGVTTFGMNSSSSGVGNIGAQFALFLDTRTATGGAGTYTYSVIVKTSTVNSGTVQTTEYTTDVSIVVAAGTDRALVPSAAFTNAYLATSATAAADATIVPKLSTASTTAAAYINVFIKNASDTQTAQDTITVSVAGPGLIYDGSSYGKSLSGFQTGLKSYSIVPDGSAGVSTITIKTSITGQTFTKSVTFYATAAATNTLVASVYHPVLKVGANDNAVRVVAKDVDGNIYAGAVYIYASSAADALIAASATPLLCTYSTTGLRHDCNVTTTLTGAAKLKVINAATVAAATATSNEITVTVRNATAATVKISFDKATYAPNERAQVRILPLDAAGLPIAAATYSNLFATGGISTTAGLTGDTLTTVSAVTAAATSSTTQGTGSSYIGTNANHQTYYVFMPAAGGVVTLTATGGTSLPLAGQVAVTATATVTDSGAQALAAVTALATTVASLKTLITTLTNLVLKIQKKVKA